MKIYCDMDGVLVNLVGGIIKASEISLNSELITEILSMDWGFRKEHPHDTNSTIRIAFVKETTADSVFPLITEACAAAAEIYNEIKSQF